MNAPLDIHASGAIGRTMTSYRERLDALPHTLAQARRIDVSEIVKSLRAAQGHPLIAVGSGGSLVTANLLARLAERLGGTVARSVTPLELVSEPALVRGHHLWLISAEGTNPDILAALDASLAAEPERITILCNRESSPLVEMGRKNRAHLLVYPTEGQKDGFLATHTLILSCSLLLRAEAAIAGLPDPLPSTSGEDLRTPPSNTDASEALRRVLGAQTLLVVFDPRLVDGANLIETNLWEAALANVQAVDFRNFAHGRHLWLAKRGADAGLLVLVSDRTALLWEEMAALIPAEVDRAVLDFRSDDPALILAGLLTAMHITDLAGDVAGRDAGKPGVPTFGRDIYHLPGLRTMTEAGITPAARKQAAIRGRLGAMLPIETLEVAEHRFRTRISKTRFDALILDYDGTIVETSRRRQPPETTITEALVRFLERGGKIGIATGRGDSVGSALREFLPKSLWGGVIVGYYNGALCQPLDEKIDRGCLTQDRRLTALDAAFRSSRFYAAAADIKNQRSQLGFSAAEAVRIPSLRDMICELAGTLKLDGLKFATSSHSVDVLVEGVSKLNVIDAVGKAFGIAAPTCLRIGDCGAFPGNDHELLASPYGLSVDRVSDDPDSCWNLLCAGVSGPRGLAAYLARLSIETGDFTINVVHH